MHAIAISPATTCQVVAQEMRPALALLVLSAFINYVDRGNLSIAAPLLRGEMGLSASQLGILLSSFFWGYTVSLLFSGWFVDRFDVNKVLGSGFVLWSLATAATGLVHGFALLLVVRVLLGVGESVAFPSYSKILARKLPEHERGFANGAIIAGMKLGPAAGTLGTGLLMAHFGWRAVFVGIGLVSLLWVPAWMKWRPRGAGLSPQDNTCPSVSDIFHQRQFWANAAAAFCCAYPLYFMVTWLPLYLIHARHLSMSDTAKIAALYYGIDAAAALATGWVTDRCIRRGSGVGLVRKWAMAVGWITAASGFAGAASAGPESWFTWLLVTGIGLGIGNSGVWAITQTLAGPQAAGRWAGLKNGFSNLAGVICPALTGFTVEWSGDFRAALGITAAVCLVGAIAWVALIGEIRQVDWTRSRPRFFSPAHDRVQS
ncbi:MAG TPA: MFS transporter [Steroidobacteraceae bacterium]|nr:MFS transporter [Steroidobacteraceae bacterium]